MLGSLQMYRASPEAFFASLDKKIAELEAKINGAHKRFEDLASLSDAILTRIAEVRSHSEAPKTWTYLAALPNLYFADVSPAENIGGVVRRWVGRSGRIGARLNLPRTCQYYCMFRAVEFANPALAATLSLTVNGEPYPWLDAKDGIYKTLILESADQDYLEFNIAVNTSTLDERRDVSFSFAQILLERRG
jgi:hypothetical protein